MTLHSRLLDPHYGLMETLNSILQLNKSVALIEHNNSKLSDLPEPNYGASYIDLWWSIITFRRSISQLCFVGLHNLTSIMEPYMWLISIYVAALIDLWNPIDVLSL